MATAFRRSPSVDLLRLDAVIVGRHEADAGGLGPTVRDALAGSLLWIGPARRILMGCWPIAWAAPHLALGA